MPDASRQPPAAAARALLAREALGLDPRPSDVRVGALELRPHQRHAAARLRYALRHYRVALLADDVGLGKTAVALALLRDRPDALVVAPAALRPHWTAALRDAGLVRRVVTMEALGRDSPPAATAAAPRLIVADEAHHFRNRRTVRWRHLAALAADARLLLLSATPVHNRPDDLTALFALTLGARADALDAATLARLVVRRAATDIASASTRTSTAPPLPGRPTVAPTVWLDLDDAPDLLDALHALPSAVAPSDGAAVPDLDRYTLLRLWTSSDAAFRAGLRRRLARALAVGDALDAGRPPSRADLRALTRGVAADPTTVQLSLLTPASPAAKPRPATRAELDAYVASLRHLLVRTCDTFGDARRAAHVRAIRARHSGERVVAFSHSTDTVRALYRALAPDGRVAMLTAAGGRIASGPLPRADVLARFAPLGQHRRAPADVERIDLLLTTDVLSEGLDLRDASVVVHLDLPWTPARLAQRTGRAVRPGAPAPVVAVYAFRPPPTAARALRLAAHARAKRRAAGLTVGVGALEDGAALGATPVDVPTSAARPSPAVAQLARDRRLERWSDACNREPPALGNGTAARTLAVRCGTTGYLAVIARPTCLGALRVPTLVAAIGHRAPTANPAVVRRALAYLAQARVTLPPCPAHVGVARRSLARWARRQLARDAVALARPVVRDVDGRDGRHDARAAFLTRTARALHAAAPSEHAPLAVAAGRLRDALTQPMSAQREAAIRDADPGAATDAEWLLAASRAATGFSSGHQADARPALRALVLLVE
ncbi:hypothetical protein tb265_25490 [Gemmatimonadetes bacterium T265]|nr:hypothetical protein tb265_25490 [Gemmatimonadetes bacterium T265]